MLDAIEGAVRMHVFAAPQLSDEICAGIRADNEQLVDEQLLLQHVGPLRGYPPADHAPNVVAAAPHGDPLCRLVM